MVAHLTTLRNLLTTLAFVVIVAVPMALHMAQQSPTDAGAENRALATAPTFSELAGNWSGFPDAVNAWMRDRFGLRATYLQIGFELDKVLPSSANFKAVRGDDGWLFNTLNGALAQHRGLLPFATGEADAWLDALFEMQTYIEASGPVFVAAIAPNKHTIYPEYLTGYPRQVAGETRLDEVQRLAAHRDAPLIDLRPGLMAAKDRGKIYYQTDSHWTDLGAYHGFQALRDALLARGVEIPDIPDDALVLREKPDFQGDLYGLLGIEDGAPERVTLIKRPQIAGPKPAAILIVGDSFTGQLQKYFEATFQTVDFLGNNAGDPDFSGIDLNQYDVVLFEIVERYLSRPLSPVLPGR